MRKNINIIFIVLSIIFYSTSTYAKIYQIPKPLWEETKAKYKLYKATPTSNETRFELAMCYGYTGQIIKGWDMLKTVSPNYAPVVVEKYEALATQNPKEWKYRFKLAFGYYFLDRKDDAIAEFKQVLQIDPKHIWAMGFIALLEGEQNHVNETIYWCDKALKIEPNATAVHFLLAEAYRRKGDFFKALNHAMISGRLLSEEAIKRPSEDDDKK